MKTINLNIDALQVNEEKLLVKEKTTTLGICLGNFLVGSNAGDANKYYDWATRLHKGESLSVSIDDFCEIYTFVKYHQQMTNLIKAQILKELAKA